MIVMKAVCVSAWVFVSFSYIEIDMVKSLHGKNATVNVSDVKYAIYSQVKPKQSKQSIQKEFGNNKRDEFESGISRLK